MILASSSPQRRAILSQLGIAFEVEVPEVVELEAGEAADVQALVVENALRKARAVAGRPGSAGRLVLGADTAVAARGAIHGKPPDAAAAAELLRGLSGREHAVWSGIALVEGDLEQTASACTVVRFRDLDEDLVSWYVGSGEWRGRAGGYAIQERGGALVAEVRGDYLGVVGLPVATLLDLRPQLLTG